MAKTIIRRLLIMIPQLFVIMAFTFLLAYIMPGDFISQQMMDPSLTAEEIQVLIERWGSDAPWYMQFWYWFTGVIRLDFGFSYVHARPVMAVMQERIVRTFWLSLSQTIVSLAIGIPLGILAGRYYRKIADQAILIYGFVGLALPGIVWGIILIFVFALRLDWLPFRGSVDPVIAASGTQFQIIVSQFRHLILPTLAGATLTGIGTIYTLRAQIVEGRFSDYALTARSKGVPERVVFNRHILRNSLIPIAQSVGFILVGLLSGTVLIERIFSYPGMGMLFLDSLERRDFPVVNALILIFSSLSVFAILIGDIALTLVDPRIRIK